MGKNIIVFWLLLFLPLHSFSAEKIVLSTGDFPPMNSKSIKHYGLVPRIVTEAFRLEGIEVEYEFSPWKRAYQRSSAGLVDGSIQWLYSVEREADHYYSEAIMQEKVVWFHMKNKLFNWDSFFDLKGMKICAVRGFTYNAHFYEAIEKNLIDVHFVGSPIQCIGMLLKNRMDIYPETIDVGLYLIAKKYSSLTAEKFSFHEKPMLTTDNYLVLPRKLSSSPRLLKKFNNGIQLMKESGTLDRYIQISRQQYGNI